MPNNQISILDLADQSVFDITEVDGKFICQNYFGECYVFQTREFADSFARSVIYKPFKDQIWTSDIPLWTFANSGVQLASIDGRWQGSGLYRSLYVDDESITWFGAFIAAVSFRDIQSKKISKIRSWIAAYEKFKSRLLWGTRGKI